MESAFDQLIELAGRIGITVRHAHLGGTGGGVALVRDQRQLFIDLDADPQDQLERTARALSAQPEIETVFVRPDVRDLIEQFRGDETQKHET
jgi:hypothetical protein